MLDSFTTKNYKENPSSFKMTNITIENSDHFLNRPGRQWSDDSVPGLICQSLEERAGGVVERQVLIEEEFTMWRDRNRGGSGVIQTPKVGVGVSEHIYIGFTILFKG